VEARHHREAVIVSVRLLDGHKGHHRATSAGIRPLRRARALLASIGLRLAWRERPPRPAAPPAPARRDSRRAFAEMAASRAAGIPPVGETPPRPTYYGRHDGAIVVGERNEVLVRPVNGRYLGTLPRRTTPDAPPWDVITAQQPAIDERGPHFFASEIECEDCERESGEPEEPVYPCCEHCHTGGAPCLQPDSHPLPCADGCNAPVYGQAPVADVLEAERLAEAMIP
jgi:hypothetical protein